MDNLSLEELCQVITSWPVETLLNLKEYINIIPDKPEVEFGKKLYVAMIDCLIESKEKGELI